MSYGEDFAGVDPAAIPLDPTILIGADPMFWGAVLLALLVAALVGYLFGSGSRSKRPDAAGAIWEAVNDAAKSAMKADTESLPARAAHLDRVIRARLGKTLAFCGGLSPRVEDLKKAIDGVAADPHHHDGHPSGHDHGHDGGHDSENGHDGHGAAAPTASGNVTIVSVHAGGAAHPPHKPDHDRRAMTAKERNRALRLAVSDFNDHWRHRSLREAEMRAVVAELCNPGEARPRLSHGGDH